MTQTEFLTEHGKAWRALREKPVFAALLLMIDDASPARLAPTRQDNDKLHGSAVFLNEIAGWESLRKLIVNLGIATIPDAEVPDTFKDPEIS